MFSQAIFRILGSDKDDEGVSKTVVVSTKQIPQSNGRT